MNNFQKMAHTHNSGSSTQGTTTHSGHHNMKNSNDTSWTRHNSGHQLTIDELIESCEFLKNQLNSFIEELENVRSRYANAINTLSEQQGLIRNNVQKFQDNQLETDKLVEKLITNIESNDIKEINKIIDWLESLPR